MHSTFKQHFSTILSFQTYISCFLNVFYLSNSLLQFCSFHSLSFTHILPIIYCFLSGFLFFYHDLHSMISEMFVQIRTQKQADKVSNSSDINCTSKYEIQLTLNIQSISTKGTRMMYSQWTECWILWHDSSIKTKDLTPFDVPVKWAD